jgi:hypothetical protein
MRHGVAVMASFNRIVIALLLVISFISLSESNEATPFIVYPPNVITNFGTILFIKNYRKNAKCLYIYLRQIKSERDLPICETEETVCSVLQKRYWLPSVLSRYCRCPSSVECPTDWASPDVITMNETSALSQKRFGINYSLQLNN